MARETAAVLCCSLWFLLSVSAASAGEPRGSKTIDIDAKDETLALVVDRIRTMTGENIVLGTDKDGKPLEENKELQVTIHLEGAFWEAALRLVCENAGVKVEVLEGNIWRVYQPPEVTLSEETRFLVGERTLNSLPDLFPRAGDGKAKSVSFLDLLNGLSRLSGSKLLFTPTKDRRAPDPRQIALSRDDFLEVLDREFVLQGRFSWESVIRSICRKAGASVEEDEAGVWNVEMRPPFTLSLDRADLRDAVRIVEAMGDAKAIVSPGIPERKKVSVSVSTPFTEEALESIAMSAGLFLHKDDRMASLRILGAVEWLGENPRQTTTEAPAEILDEEEARKRQQAWTESMNALFGQLTFGDHPELCLHDLHRLQTGAESCRFPVTIDGDRTKLLENVNKIRGAYLVHMIDSRISALRSVMKWTLPVGFRDAENARGFSQLLELLSELKSMPESASPEGFPADATKDFSICRKIFLGSLERLASPEGVPGAVVQAYFRTLRLHRKSGGENAFLADLVAAIRPFEERAETCLEFRDLDISLAGLSPASAGNPGSATVNGKPVKEGDAIRIESRGSRVAIVLENVESAETALFRFKGILFRVSS